MNKCSLLPHKRYIVHSYHMINYIQYRTITNFSNILLPFTPTHAVRISHRSGITQTTITEEQQNGRKQRLFRVYICIDNKDSSLHLLHLYIDSSLHLLDLYIAFASETSPSKVTSIPKDKIAC